ncbi:MAG TPA: 4Fe-4S binding protein [Candidatus Limnocylindrales bacterium]
MRQAVRAARHRCSYTGLPAALRRAGWAGAFGRSTAISTLYVSGERRPRRAPTIIDFVNIRWVDEWCKRCNICVEICPKDTLVLTHDAIIEAEDCIRCGLCERYCPDLAIEVLPKRDAEGNLPAEFAAAQAASTATSTGRPRVPDAARGPAVAGTNPERGITDAESAPDVDRANPT